MKVSWTLLLAAVSGCAAPAYVAGLRPEAKATPWARHEEHRLGTKDGTILFCQSWHPNGRAPQNVVVLVHGLKDHSDRYLDFAKALVTNGFAVHACDLRGHGDSTGDRVWVEHFDDYLDDLELQLRGIAKAEPGRRVFLFGHSMGGAIVTLYALTREPKPAGIVLSAAALKVSEGGAVQGVTKALGTVAPTLAVFSLDDSKFSRRPEVVEAMKTDPLIYDKAAPAHTAAEVIRAVDRIRAGALDVPVLALHGSADAVTPPDGSRELVEAAKTPDRKLLTYDGLYHDLLHEPEGSRVTGDIITWLEEHSK